MEKLTTQEDFLNLKTGERVVTIKDGTSMTLCVGGILDENRLVVFYKNMHTESLWLGNKNKDWKSSRLWFKGEYNSTFIGMQIIKSLQSRIRIVERVYLKNPDTDVFIKPFKVYDNDSK